MKGAKCCARRADSASADRDDWRRSSIWTWRFIVPAILALIFLPGCMAPRRITVIDAWTYEMKSFPPGGDTWYTSWLPTGRQSDSILYIVQAGPQLEIVHRDLSGRVLSRRAIPFFDPFLSYLHALSPDETLFAYYRGKSDELWLYDVRTGEDRVLLRNVYLSSFQSRLFWMSDRELIAIEAKSPHPEKAGAEILKMDVSTRTVVGRLTVVEGGDIAFYAPRKILALAPFEPGAGIAIIDLENMKVVGEVSNPTPHMTGDPAWNADGSRLLFRGGDDWLTEYSMRERTVRRVLGMPGNEVCYFVGYVNDETCAYQCDDPKGKKSAHLDFVNLATGQVTKSLRAPFNGRTGVIANGEKLVSWTGYR
jgi:hypothetical protein